MLQEYHCNSPSSLLAAQDLITQLHSLDIQTFLKRQTFLTTLRRLIQDHDDITKPPMAESEKINILSNAVHKDSKLADSYVTYQEIRLATG